VDGGELCLDGGRLARQHRRARPRTGRLASPGYFEGGPNQNVIVFHDDVWPYELADYLRGTGATEGPVPTGWTSPVIALTTVTYDTDSGEILHADIELNSADHGIVVDDGTAGLPPDTFDLQTILTHETGHFFGLAHSPRVDAVMYAAGDTTGSTRKRLLTEEDVSGICAVYPAGRNRGVSTLVSASGDVPESACDPIPHGGLATGCGG
jgi:hypothetical protein